MAIPRLRSLCGPSRQPAHPAGGARVQGIRGANGTDARSHASDLKPLKFQRMDDGCAEAVLSQMLRAQSR